MELFSCPKEVPAPEPDYANYDCSIEQMKEAEHQEDLKDWLVRNGYPGKNTGRIVRFPIADGCAQYMLAEGPTSRLIHLPYGDAWHYYDARYIPKKEILRRAV